MTNNDIARKIVDRMTEIIDREGVLPWSKPWADERSVVRVEDGETTVTVPVKFWSRSGKAYSGVNVLLLGMSGHTGEFITFNQAKTEGGKIRKGAKGWPVVYWNMIRKDTGKTDEDGNPVFTTYPMLKYYTVFSIDDVDGLETKHHPEPVTFTLPKWHYEPVAGVDESSFSPAAESVVAGYLSRAKTLSLHREDRSDRAYYSPSADTVVVPCVCQYHDIGEYYSTMFHELGHSTGHSSRLNRFTGQAANAAFGSEEYSKEELVAEITAASLLSLLGLESGNSFRNSAAYVQSWSSHIKNDPMMFVSAAGKAEKAIDLILGTGENASPDPEPTPDPDEKPETEPETPAPSAPAFPARENLTALSFSYRIRNSVGQANLSPELLTAANASTLKVILPMFDGIEDAETRKHAFFTLAALAWYDAKDNPERKPRFRQLADLYGEKTGEPFPVPETDDKPAAPKAVSAAMKRIYKGSRVTDLNGILSKNGWSIAASLSHVVYLRSSAPDLPAAPKNSETESDKLLAFLERVESSENAGTLPLPSVKELKAWIKCNPVKIRGSRYYDLDGIDVDAGRLLDMLEALPGCTAARPASLKDPILFKSGEDRGILMQLFPKGSSETSAA